MNMHTLLKRSDMRHLPAFIVLALGAIAATMHLFWVDRLGDESLIPLSIIFWLSVGILIWQRRQTIEIEKVNVASLLGSSLLVLFVILGFQSLTDAYAAGSPFIAMLGIALLSAGLQCFRQYRSELLLMFFLGVPRALLWSTLDLRETTAKFSTMLLNLSRFDAIRENQFIHLPNGSVEVIQDCSGLNGILYLIAMSVLFLIMLPIKGWKRYFVPLVGIGIAFLSNGARVAFLAVAAASPDPKVFEFWHGTSMFSLGALGVFCAVYFIFLQQERSLKQVS
ncbi:MAG: cyanoexosortase A [Cyanobacteria bacterium P01_F01_bin.150]